MQSIRVAQACALCPALVANRRRIVHGYGPPDAAVLLVGEAPGYKGADLTGIPFTRDRSGIRLQQLLIGLGLSAETDPRAERPRLQCFVTNTVRCNPPANRTPHRTELSNCLPYLWQELALVEPKIIVPVGNVATRAVFDKLIGQAAPPIGQAHARVFAGDGRMIVPLRHPARISNADLERFASTMQPLLAGTTPR